MDPKTTPNKAIETAEVLVTPQVPDVATLWLEGLVTETTTHGQARGAEPTLAASGAIKPEPGLSEAQARSQEVMLPPVPYASNEVLVADPLRPVAPIEMPAHGVPGWGLEAVSAREIAESKASEWQLEPLEAARFSRHISRLVGAGRSSEEQVSKALQLAVNERHAIRIIESAAKSNVDVALQAELLGLAEGFKSPGAVLTQQFKEFYVASSADPLAQGEDRAEIQLQLSPGQIDSHAGLVERKLEEFDDLRGLMKSYLDQVSIEQERPVSFNLLIKVYSRLGSVEAVEELVQALVDQSDSSSHWVIAKSLIEYVDTRGAPPADMASFVEEYSFGAGQLSER